MPLASLPPTDTRHLFRPVSTELTRVLRGLQPEDWHRPTLAGRWVVRDVLAHLVDVALRRVSFHRDRMPPPPAREPLASDADFVRFINGLNAEWVEATRRCSPRVLTDLFERASTDLADWFESLPLEAPALFGVSWAGEQASEGWFDVGREFTELWHHQEQIRLAVGAPSLADPRHLRAVLEVAVRGLPHAFRDVPAETGRALVIEVTGASGATWSLVRDASRWTLHAGEAPSAANRVRLSDEHAWRLLFNALPEADAAADLEIHGDPTLPGALLKARSIVV